MKLRAILLDACRELVYRRTLLVYFGIVTLTHLLLLLALQTDVANGMISSVRVFGLQGRAAPHGFSFGDSGAAAPLGLDPATLVRGIQIAVTWVLYPMGMLLAIFATASLVPHMLEKGTIDLLLSKPVSRPALLLARYLGGLAIAGANLLYFAGGVGTILALKTGVWNAGFFLSALLMTAYFGALLAFVVLVGLVTRSTTVSIMASVLIYFVSLVVRLPHANADWPMLLSSRPARFAAQGAVEGLYHLLPRTWDLGYLVTALVLGRPVESWAPVGGTILSGAAALLVAVLWFRRVDF